MGVAAYRTQIKLGGTPTAFTDTATTALSSVKFQITDTTKRVLDRDTLPTVKDSAVAVDSSLYTLDYLFGVITFTTAPSSDVTVSGNYLPVGSSERIANVTNYELNMGGTILDGTNLVSAQDSSGYRSRVYGLHDTSVSLSGFHDMSSAIEDALNNRDAVLIDVNPIGLSGTYRGWFVVENKNLSGGVDELEGEDISLQLDDKLTSENDHVSESWSS